jgi:hypothetical protein
VGVEVVAAIKKGPFLINLFSKQPRVAAAIARAMAEGKKVDQRLLLLNQQVRVLTDFDPSLYSLPVSDKERPLSDMELSDGGYLYEEPEENTSSIKIWIAGGVCVLGAAGVVYYVARKSKSGTNIARSVTTPNRS